MRDPIRDFFDALAPKWDGWAKDDLSSLQTIFQRIGIVPGERILDLACGTGVITGLLHQLSQAPVHGIDLSPKMIEIAKTKYADEKEISFESGDFLELPPQTYDLIVIYNASPHFIDTKKLAKTLALNLAPNGRFLILHDASKEAINAHHQGMDHALFRDLSPIDTEFLPFAKDFTLLLGEDEPDHYLILGRKK